MAAPGHACSSSFGKLKPGVIWRVTCPGQPLFGPSHGGRSVNFDLTIEERHRYLDWMREYARKNGVLSQRLRL